MIIGILPCAGKGTRSGATGPKELLQVGTHQLIEYSLDVLRKRNVRDLTLVVAPGKESVAKYVALAGPDFALSTVYQREPLGTGHAIGLVSKLYDRDQRFLYLMPDTVHQGMPVQMPKTDDVTVFLWQTNRPEEMGNFAWDATGFVNGHVEKRKPDWDPPYWAWGAAILTKSFLEYAARWSLESPAGKEFTIDDVFDRWLASGRQIAVAFCSGWYQDCGSAEGIKRAEELLRRK